MRAAVSPAVQFYNPFQMKKREVSMLNVYFVDMPESIYDTKIYFNNTCKDSWITKQLSREMIKAVDRSDVIDERTIHSPVFGNIDPKKLSGGVKTLMLIAYDKTKIFNASKCGDNCAEWILKIAEKQKIVINLRHLMDFGEGEFKTKVLNTGKIVKTWAILC